jgi:hypothetical protein
MNSKKDTDSQNTPPVDYSDREPAQKEGLPAGPFGQGGEECKVSLLIFVPRNAISTLINAATGDYGYSHLAVDCGEVDIPTGKRVMIEATVGQRVHYSFQDEYGDRKFVRIPLEKTGIDLLEFCDCIHSKLGEKYDDEEALTFGLIHNPARQICSDLATVCLPDKIRTRIAHSYRSGQMHSLSAMRLFEGPHKTFRLFVSPNGFAEFFGTPRGDKLNGPDQLAEPILPPRWNLPLRIFMRTPRA